MSGLEERALACQGCEGCPLSKTRRRVVYGEGSSTARVMFVGEGPGAQEDLSGRPFVGPAGQLLTKILAAVSLTREEVYIGNIVKCRPPGNRDPLPAEMAACEHWLLHQIACIRPRIIVALGNVAQRYFLGADGPGITRVRGRFFPWRDGIEIMPMYHPSYLLRNEARHKGSPKWQTWQDIRSLRARLDEGDDEKNS